MAVTIRLMHLFTGDRCIVFWLHVVISGILAGGILGFRDVLFVASTPTPGHLLCLLLLAFQMARAVLST